MTHKTIKNNSNQVVSLGCRLNIFEAELIKKQALLANVENSIIVNTCTVTQEAHRQSMQQIRKLKKENPNATIIVTGCGAQVDPQSFANMPEVNKVIGNKDKFSIKALESSEKIIVNDVNSHNDAYKIPLIKGFANKTKAFIQVQQGCDHRCTFCIIQQARGNSRSVSTEDIITQVKQAVAFGHKEIILTGVDISSWNRNALSNEPSQLGQLCLDILKAVPKLPRLRLSSLDPAVPDNNILTLLKNEERFMPHIHLSLQAMNNSVLKHMGRRHCKESATTWIEELKSANPNVAIGADIICGFPKETTNQHQETLKHIQELQIPFLHVFPYSERENTVATKIKPQVPINIRKERAKTLIDIGYTNKANFFAKYVGKTMQMLVESNNVGYTQNYCPVQLISEKTYSREIINIKITGYNKQHLLAKLVI